MTPRNRGKKLVPPPAVPVRAGKHPREGRSTGGERPTWGVSQLDPAGPFGQIVDPKDVTEILDFLPKIEKLTWDEVLQHRRKGGHHQTEVRLICKEAQRRLKERGIYAKSLISLRLTGEKRLWGIREGAVFHVLWWDPDHRVYPTKKRHT